MLTLWLLERDPWGDRDLIVAISMDKHQEQSLMINFNDFYGANEAPREFIGVTGLGHTIRSGENLLLPKCDYRVFRKS